MSLVELLSAACAAADHAVAVVGPDGAVVASSPSFRPPLHPLPARGVAPEGGRDLLVLPLGELRLVVELPTPPSLDVAEAAVQLRRLAAAGRRQREELATLLAHEANSPLAAIISDLGYVREALEGADGDPARHDPAAAEALADAEEAAHRVHAAVRRLQARALSPVPVAAPGGERGQRSDGERAGGTPERVAPTRGRA